MSIGVLTDVVTGWDPSLETVGIYAVVVTALYVTVQAVAVSLQAWYIRGGLEQMREASKQRDKQLEQQAAESERRHRESMGALEALIKSSENRHQESMRALEALIERTAAS